MKKVLQFIALALFATTVGFWVVKGAHTGWSQNRVPVTKHDEITSIAYTVYEDRFVPGIDVLAAGVGLAGGFFAASFFFRPKNINPTS